MTSLPVPAGDLESNLPITAADLARFRDEILREFKATCLSPVTPIAFTRFRAEMLDLFRPPLRSKGHFGKVRHVLDLVGALSGPEGTTAALDTELVVKLLASRPPAESAHTTQAILTVLKTICKIAAEKGYCRVNPFALRKQWIRTRAAAVKKHRHHSIEDIARVLELARTDIHRKLPHSPSQWRARRLYAIVATVAHTGMRRNEVLRLRVEDIDIPHRVIDIVPRVGNELKTEGSAQPVPMTEALARILAEWIPHLAIGPELAAKPAEFTPDSNPTGKRDAGWLFPNAYRTGPWTGGPTGKGRPIDRIKRLGERCGIPGFTFQSLRHSWATHAETKWGLSDLQIQRVLRHTTVKTQTRYRHADLPNLRQAIQSVGFGVATGEGCPDPTSPATDGLPPPAALKPARPSNPKNPSKPGVWHGLKLDDDDVAEMRELRDRGWTYTRLRVRYGVSKSTLHAALHGLTHRNVPMPPAEGEAHA